MAPLPKTGDVVRLRSLAHYVGGRVVPQVPREATVGLVLPDGHFVAFYADGSGSRECTTEDIVKEVTS